MSKTQFMHYRATASALALLATPRKHNDAPVYRGATVAITPTSDTTVAITVAYCGQNDIFNKKLGRTIAEGRMKTFLSGKRNLKVPVQIIEVSNMDSMKDEVASVLAAGMAAVGLE